MTSLWVVIVFWLSCALNVTGMRGHDAMEMHLSNYVEQAESTLEARQSAGLLIDSVSADIRLESARYRLAAKNELRSGNYTGSPGRGDVMNALNAIAKRLEDFLKEAKAYEKRVSAGIQSAQTKLDRMRQIATDEASLEERLRLMARASNSLRQDLTQLDHRPLAEALQRVLTGLPREVDTHVKLSANPDLARRQRAALDRIEQDILQTTAVLNAFIEESLSEERRDLATLEDMTPYKAVLAYWDHYIPFWAAGIGLDMLPLIVILFSLLSLSSKTPSELAYRQITQMSIGDYMLAVMGGEALRRVGMSPEAMQEMIDQMQGKFQLPSPPQDPSEEEKESDETESKDQSK